MANDVPASYTAPNPDLFFPERRIRGEGPEGWTTIGQALNYIHAQMHASPVISQGWLVYGILGQSLNITTSNVFKQMCRWRIPPWLPGERQLRLSVYATLGGGAASGVVRFRSVNAGDSVALNVVGDGWVQSLVGDPLKVDADLGYEEVQLDELVTNGVGNLQVHSVHAEYVPLASPLAAGALDGVIPLDLDELDPDEPLSADTGHVLYASMLALRARQQSYMCWSGLESSDNANAQDHMDNYTHRVWAPVHPGTLQKDLKLTVHARTSNPSASNASVRLHHGGSTIGLPDSTGWTLAAGAVAAWQTTDAAIPNTVRLAERQGLPDLPHAFSQLALDPGPNLGLELRTTGRVHSISAWSL
jgi:hypothetical protein